ncbi:16S rRNA (uracil(1498)-N(3))-methyltransferase [Virgisporangium ochraceum]|uniref:Ribosomal RNA small subunit methyltransferase E n=1 Tax=Virgisporangium ochraceum TaxID=65505 RepID=A0A8J3ZPT6_9ACTN|nr:16S rRNA (uracil(1498)-N(3))-methyltransferase [Virgisporangium ochraceum]GIJ67724.1 ribosomal RNA small subunit methyltransferase E [Virgisporangium ochraceum]
MSPPLFLVDELPPGDVLRLDGPEGHHAAVVQRLRVGERIVVGDGRGTRASAVVTAVRKGVLDAELVARSHRSAARPSIAVVQGIAKGDRAELAVATMTEVGVDRIVPWQAARTVVRWKDDRPLQRWRATAREATKQSRRAWLPDVADPVKTADAARMLAGTAVALVLHEESDRPLSTVDLPAEGEIAVVVGPEGGIDADELSVFVAAGALPVRLGSDVLRTSTAGAAAVAALSVRLGRW